MLKSLRVQFLFILLGLGGVNLILILFYFMLVKQKKQIEEVELLVNKVVLVALNDAKNINGYFTFETKNSNYFETGNSEYLLNHQKDIEHLSWLCQQISNHKNIQGLDTNANLDSIKVQSEALKNNLDTVTKLIYDRGFKDYGIEGLMRKNAHNLERSEYVDKVSLLMLRRHEKDYIIRNDAKYIEKFNTLAQTLYTDIEAKRIPAKQKAEILSDLEQYRHNFSQLVQLDKLIGISNNTASRLKIEQTISNILNHANQLTQNLNLFKDRAYDRIKWASIILVLLMLSISVYLGLKLSALITRRIKLLSSTISKYIDSCFTYTQPVDVADKNDEVGILISNFETMRHKLSGLIEHLEVKVAERTEEITLQKEQIQTQNEKMMDSLRYAMKIQEAILPDSQFIKSSFAEHFIYYMPKDLVSGDFYWHKRIDTTEHNYSLFAVADCTGHGVPGAFMSMISIAFLNEIVLKNDALSPDEILEALKHKIIDNLSHKNNSRALNDGLDISLILIDNNKNTLMFSGANHNLYIVRNGEMQVFKGDRMPIGKYARQDRVFTLHETKLEPNDMIYMFTDGLADQSGGHAGNKYLIKQLRVFLTNLSWLPVQEQKMKLTAEFNGWKKGYDQTDDVLIAGIRFVPQDALELDGEALEDYNAMLLN